MDGLLENTLTLMKEAAGLPSPPSTPEIKAQSLPTPPPHPTPPIGVTSEGLAFEASADQS